MFASCLKIFNILELLRVNEKMPSGLFYPGATNSKPPYLKVIVSSFGFIILTTAYLLRPLLFNMIAMTSNKFKEFWLVGCVEA